MIGQKHCPYCLTPAQRGCPHLALAVEARDFVRRCVERSEAQAQWQTLCQRRRGQLQSAGQWSPERDDFTWLETAFCDELLRRLSWFGAMDYEWAVAHHRFTFNDDGDLTVPVFVNRGSDTHAQNNSQNAQTEQQLSEAAFPTRAPLRYRQQQKPKPNRARGQHGPFVQGELAESQLPAPGREGWSLCLISSELKIRADVGSRGVSCSA